MVQWLKKLERFQHKVEMVLMYLSGGLILTLMFLITADVIMRKLGSPILGAFELVQILTVSIIFLGIAFVQRVKGHIFIEVATDKLPEVMKRGLDFFGYVVGFFICSVITWQCGLAAWESLAIMEYSSGIVPIPLWQAKWIVAIGMALLTTRIGWDILYFLFPVLRVKSEQHRHIEEGEKVWL
ncbi:TRAP transporter small permease [Bacillus sp. B15-48]|uniref:TRAP transporter small permease subunit n=1 Tax=Bacillus sp. B15-48 TaxID=1548601 RepID=UPI001EF27379|nr:TRAP transporter small permease [Bacillus sp. B15-48]